MRQINEIKLARDQLNGLKEIRERLFAEFDVEAIILFGSVARGEADEESDIDLLILTSRPYERPERHKITDLIFEVNLQNDTNFSSLVIDRNDWERGTVSVLPIHEEIIREGISV